MENGNGNGSWKLSRKSASNNQVDNIDCIRQQQNEPSNNSNSSCNSNNTNDNANDYDHDDDGDDDDVDGDDDDDDEADLHRAALSSHSSFASQSLGESSQYLSVAAVCRGLDVNGMLYYIL